jgi:BMFP domain-containing protein YqiC
MQLKTEQENLKDELYEILKTTKDLIESKHQIALTIIDLKNKHDAVNSMALRTDENLEDLQAKLEQIESSLEEYKKKQDLCINYKPLRP